MVSILLINTPRTVLPVASKVNIFFRISEPVLLSSQSFSNVKHRKTSQLVYTNKKIHPLFSGAALYRQYSTQSTLSKCEKSNIYYFHSIAYNYHYLTLPLFCRLVQLN